MVGCVDESLITRLMGRLRTSNNLGQLCELYSFISSAVSFKVYNSITAVRNAFEIIMPGARPSNWVSGAWPAGIFLWFVACVLFVRFIVTKRLLYEGTALLCTYCADGVPTYCALRGAASIQ